MAPTSRLLKLLLKKPNAMRLDQLESLAPVSAGRVVFLGDALAHDGLWNEWFPQLPTMNNGMTATCVSDTLDRLGRTVIAPRAVVVMAGNSDLAGMGRSREPAAIAFEIELLLAALRTHFPAASVLITSALPTARSRHAGVVARLNTHIRVLALGFGVTYVDVFDPLADAHGVLRPEFSGRGLNGAGYRAVAAALAPHLESLREVRS